MTGGWVLQPAAHIGVITALRREARLLAGPRLELSRVIRLDARVCLYVCGMGPDRAGRAAEVLSDAGCEALVSFGTAGGLLPRLRAGALVVPQRVLDEDGQAFRVDDAWRKRLLNRTATGPAAPSQDLVSVTRPVLSRGDKRRLAEASGACAVDMESAAIAGFASRNAIPLLVVRAVSDDSGQSIPTALLPALDRYGEVRRLALLQALCLHPGVLPRLAGLARGAGAAERTLAALVRRAGISFAA